MIRDLINLADISAVSYDNTTETLFIEVPGGKKIRHSPVSYATYHTIVSSRFPERVYRHLIASHVLPEGVAE